MYNWLCTCHVWGFNKHGLPTQGITYAPQCPQQIADDEYTLCLANRSATLFHLSQYQVFYKYLRKIKLNYVDTFKMWKPNLKKSWLIIK